MIRERLWIKFMAGLAAVVVLGGAVLYMSINLSTRRMYETLARESDVAAAEALARIFGRYYEQTGSWRGFERYFREFTAPGGGPMPGPMGGPMGGMMMRRLGVFSRIVLTGPEGRVLLDTNRRLQGTFHPPGHIEKGVPVRAHGRLVGYLFVGTMIEPALEPVEREFLAMVNRTVIITVIAVLAAALVVTGFLVRRITGPLGRIETGAARVGSGDFSARVPVTSRDELGRVAGRFNEMAASLEEADIWRNRLISDSAHELRTPMSLIQGRLEMMLDGVYDIDRQNVKRVYDEALHMAELIEELKTLSDADRGSLVTKRVSVDLGNLAQRAVDSFRVRTEEKGIHLGLNKAESPVVIDADEGKIYQVLLNVIGNAVGYTPEGGSVEVRISPAAVRTGTARTGGEISVADTGPGVPEDKLEKIFERFFRMEETRSREHGGRGLGLAISKAIVESHGGTIRASNRPSGGLDIRILLP